MRLTYTNLLNTNKILLLIGLFSSNKNFLIKTLTKLIKMKNFILLK